MNKYKVQFSIEGIVEIDDPIEANNEDEAIDIAIIEYGNESWYQYDPKATLITEEGEEK